MPRSTAEPYRYQGYGPGALFVSLTTGIVIAVLATALSAVVLRRMADSRGQGQ